MKTILVALALTAAATTSTPVEATPKVLECNLYPVDRYGYNTPTPFFKSVKMCVAFHTGVKEKQVTIVAANNEEDSAVVSVAFSESTQTFVVKHLGADL